MKRAGYDYDDAKRLARTAAFKPIDLKAVADLDYFVPNESEAETITGLPVRNVDDAKRCA